MRPQAKFSFWESYGGLKSVDYAADGKTFSNWLQLSQYNALGRPGLAKYSINGVSEKWDYLQNGLPSSHIVTEVDNDLLLNERIGWNESNQLTTVLDCNFSTQPPCPSGSGGFPSDRGAVYDYDLLRLSSVKDADGTAINGYDDAGNLLQNDDIMFSYTGNQVVSGSTTQTPSQCDSPQSDQIFCAQYNANGNMTSRKIGSTKVGMTTSVEGWLLQTDLDGLMFERFTYDYSGQRLVKQVYQSDGTTVDHVVLYPAPDLEITLINGGTAQYTVYLIGALGKFAAQTVPLAGQDIENLAQQFGVTLDPEATPVTEQSLVFHLDQVDSTVAVTDGSGNGYATVSYDSWGKPEITPADNDAFRPLFGGKEYTSETGLYYFNARYLDTFTGRFVSADTQVAADPLVPDSFNDYAYGLNNPILFSDPSGHFPVGKVVVGVVLGATAAVLAGAGLEVLAAEEIELAVEIEEDDIGIDMVLREAEPKPAAPNESTPLLGSDAQSADAQSADAAPKKELNRTQLAKKHAGNLASNIVQSEGVNSVKYSATHSHGNWSWKGFGYSSAQAFLGGTVGFAAGTTTDWISGERYMTKDHKLIQTLIKGPIQGAAIGDMNRAFDSKFTSSSNRSWAITSFRGAGTGFVFSGGVFGLKEAFSGD